MTDQYATSPNHTHLSTPINAVDTYKLDGKDSDGFQTSGLLLMVFLYKPTIKIERII